MASKEQFQSVLKAKYGINKNISQTLSKEECERLLDLLSIEPSAVKIVESFAAKNSSLGSNNAYYGRLRNKAEADLKSLETEYQELEASIAAIESDKLRLVDRKKQLEQEYVQLQTEVQSLSTKVDTLSSQNEELIGANEQLKKDNKALKTFVDAIKLRLARDTKELLQYEDSQLRKAIIRLFRWTLG
jgi:peptidoglycan hydrolase CwlO-like protein